MKFYKIFQIYILLVLSGSSALFSQVSYNSSALYGLRKLTTTYNGNAIQVRRACDNATTDIGFTSSGTLDTIALKNFVVGPSPLNIITPAAEGAYSLRKLRCEYVGFAIRVRRSSDGSTSDIGFTTNGDLDTVSLKVFVGSGSGFVNIWYDQSGNGRNATQATQALQPRIVNAGVIEKNSSNRPSIFFNGTYLKNAFFLTTQPVSTSCVWRARGLVSPGGELFGWGNNSGTGRRLGVWFQFISGSTGRYGVENQLAGTVGSNVLSTNTWYIATQVLPGANLPALSQWINGSAQPTVNLGTATPLNITAGEFAIGTIPTANVQGHNGDIQEVIYFNAQLTATERQYLEYSQSVYYGIGGPGIPSTLPANTPDAFISAWYDQSGNGIHLTQTGGISRQPRILSSGNIIKLNGATGWPAIQGTSADQTNLTGIFSPAYTGTALTVHSVVRVDENSNANRRIWSLGNTALNSTDFNSPNFANIHQLGNNRFRFERIFTGPGRPFTVGAPMVLSGRFTGANRQMFQNGTASGIRADANTFNFTSIRLLQSINPAGEVTQAFTGKMAEFSMFYSALNTTRRRLIESNEGAFHGITTTGSKYTPPTPATYIYYVNGVGRESATDSVAATRESSGMGFIINNGAGDFLKDNGDYLTCGINAPIAPSTSTSDLPPTVIQRWFNDWYLNKTDIGSNNGMVTVYFDYSDYGVSALPGVAANYVLLSRTSPSGTFSIVPGTTPIINGDQVRFMVDASNLISSNYYTIGTLDPVSSPLPIVLSGFSAICKADATHLYWSTASETNNRYFTIEKSADAITFKAIGQVDGAGNSQQTRNYSFIDQNQVEGTTYYRLKQTDFDGKFKYSKSIAVTCGKSSIQNFTVYPNPATSIVTIELPDNNTKSTNFEIINAQGQVIYAGVIVNRVVLQIDKFVSGVYLVKVGAGENVLIKKFIKK